MADDVVTIRAGSVRGEGDDRVVRFLGIPYAAPPAGERRWRPPVAPSPWDGVRAASTAGPAARQPTGGPMAGLVPGMDVGDQGDDCLSVNVWTPATDGARRPVMVWLHGGAFSLGAGSLPAYDGTRLAAEQDVVVVTCNYRLGCFGFLHLEDPSACPNAGLLDQIAALRWVRDEITGFGGDPQNVTVFGESAGGGSVLSLLSMPAATGLFQRAIVQSGATDLLLDRAAATEVGEAFSRAAGVEPGDVAALRALPADRLVEAQAETAAGLYATVGTMPFHPCVDGRVLPWSWLDAARQGVNPVPLVIGTTRDEMGLFARMDPKVAALDADGLARRLDRQGLDPTLVVSAYAEAGLDQPPAVWTRVQTDVQMWAPALRILEARAAHAPAWTYRFDWPAADPRMGAAHGVDIPFPFGTTEQWSDFLHDPAGAAELSATIRAAWASFARTGDPSTPDLAWPSYDLERRPTLVLDGSPHVEDDPDAPVRRLWTEDVAPA
jgi:para-nitrobenzyl esterase